jgi:DnaJ-class molecular chaperone
MSTIPCPICSGKGFTLARQNPQGENMQETPQPVKVTCQTCSGTGCIVQAEKAGLPGDLSGLTDGVITH